MFDIQKQLENDSYEAAAPQTTKTLPEFVNFIKDLIFDVLTSLVLLIPVLGSSIKSLFIPVQRKSVSGKLALVTGGGNGLGRMISFRLAKEKCRIVIADLNGDAAKKTADEIRQQYGVDAKGYSCDVSNYEAVEKLQEQIKRDMGIVHILINNAGVIPAVSLREGHWLDIENQFKINVNSHVWTTRVFIEDMIKEKDGHILAISSMAGVQNTPYLVCYSAAKHAVNAFMGSLADELYLDGHEYIKTTCICPYFINTRKTYIDSVNLRFPPLEPEFAADKVVDALLTNKEFSMIIALEWLCKIAILLPNSVKRVVSVQVFKAKTVRNFTFK